VNPAFRLEPLCCRRRARVVNVFIMFASGTSSAPSAVRVASNKVEEDEVMKRATALAIVLGTALFAGTAGAEVAPAKDIQAPRTPSDDIQAPRSENQDIQAPRTKSEDIQAPRTGNEDIQAPRG